MTLETKHDRATTVGLRASVRRSVVRLSLVALLGLAVGGATARPDEAEAQNLDPVVSSAHVLVAEIYDVTKWALRVPYSVAMPLIARAGVTAYVNDLPLDPEVRERVLARVRSGAFVDEVIPFLMTVKTMYVATEQARAQSFDGYLRSRFGPDDGIPGMEHSMFAWEPAVEEDADEDDAMTGVGMTDEIAVQLIMLYDALYLGAADPQAGLGDELGCEKRTTDVALARAAERAKPMVQALLEEATAQMNLDGEIGEAVERTLSDDESLATITIALTQFIDQLVCRHYRIFATRVMREQQLREWMFDELDKSGGGRLWDYLEHAQSGRRYAMLIAVDGLQGHLVEALAGGGPADPFLAAVHREYLDADSIAPPTQHSRPAPSQQIEFLAHIEEAGFSHERYLPFFRDLYTDSSDHAGTDLLHPYGIAKVGISTTPTISVRNLPVVKTGAPVAGQGSTGIPNFHFVDRDYRRNGERRGRAYYFFGTDAMQLGSLARRAGMRSLFERLPELGSFSCAAQYDDHAHYSIDALLNLAIGERQRDFGDILCLQELEERAANELVLRELRAELLDKREKFSQRLRWFNWYRKRGQANERVLARRLISRIAALEQETVPELLLYYNPWPDHFAHFAGPFADEIISPSGELNRLDYWLGRMTGIYRKAGVAERTLFAMAGDHGLTPVFHILNPEVEVFDRLREQGVDFEVVKISSDEGEGPKLTNPLDPPSMKGIDVVVASTAGGNYMLDLFVDQAGNWARQPLYRELLAVSPLSEAGSPGASELDLIETMRAYLSETLDYLAVREEPCTVEGGTVRLVATRDGKRTDARIIRRGDRLLYQYEGADLLDIRRLTHYEELPTRTKERYSRLLVKCTEFADPADDSTWCTEEEWRLLASYTTRPDSIVQLAHLYDHDRAGTINLFPKGGIGYNTLVPGRHAGEFFHEKDAFAGAWGAPVARPGDRRRLRTAVIGSMPTAIYEYLTGTTITQGSDGWGYPSVAERLFGGAGDDAAASP